MAKGHYSLRLHWVTWAQPKTDAFKHDIMSETCTAAWVAWLLLQWIHIPRDLRSFEIWFEFKSDDLDSIRKWRTNSKFSNQPHLLLYYKPRSLFNKKLQPLHRCNWDLFCVYDFTYYVARVYTLASTVGAIVQYCLRNQENPHISVRL